MSISSQEEAKLNRATMGSDWRLVLRLARYVRKHKKLFFSASLLFALNSLTIIVPPFLVQKILDVAVAENNLALLNGLGAAYLAALVLEITTGFFSQFTMAVLGERALRDYRRDLFRHVLRLPNAFFDKNAIGRILTRLTNDVEALSEVFSSGAITAVADLFTIAGIVIVMFVLDVQLAIFSLLVMPPLIILVMVFQRLARGAFRDVRKHLARINTFLAEHIAGMSVVQIFQQEARTQREFTDLNDDYRSANRRAIAYDASLFSVVEAVGTFAVAILIWFGAVDLAVGATGAGTLVAFMQYIRRIFIPIRDLSSKYTMFQSAFAAAERIALLEDEPEAIRSPNNAIQKKDFGDEIRFEDVYFKYGDEDDGDWVLKGLNLSIKRGQKIALVGATGSGKTTILKLLNRYYDVKRGRILIDGIDIRDLELADLRQLFAIVLQDVFLFAGTIQENLSFFGGLPEEKLEEAARLVQADAFIRKLSEGYATEIQEGGANFSSGERQLISFARALAVDPKILILDEATSSVDSATEAKIQRALDLLLKGRTAIVIAHRLSTIRRADCIYVLEHGQIVESGKHEQLMAQHGAYADFVAAQFGSLTKT